MRKCLDIYFHVSIIFNSIFLFFGFWSVFREEAANEEGTPFREDVKGKANIYLKNSTSVRKLNKTI